MPNELRDKYSGETVKEYMDGLPEDLQIDAIGLWHVVVFGREGFGLSGDKLVGFVRQAVTAVLAAGAKPVVGATDGVHCWTPVGYGGTIEGICDAIVAEWRGLRRDPSVGDVWFALPHIYRGTLPAGAEVSAGDWPGYPGSVFKRPDGTIIGTRESSTGPIIDIIRSGDPSIPTGFKICQNDE